MTPLARALCQGTQAHPNSQNDLDKLDQARLISRSGDYGPGASLIVIVGGSSSPPQTTPSDDAALERQLINAFTATGNAPTVVGCESGAAISSSVPVYQQEGIASVDCIDEPLGALDLAYALHGEAASYGVKPSAQRLIPASLEKPPLTL